MSKCSVLSTSNLNFLYCTLFWPKYWASARGAARRPATITTPATARFRHVLLFIGGRSKSRLTNRGNPAGSEVCRPRSATGVPVRGTEVFCIRNPQEGTELGPIHGLELRPSLRISCAKHLRPLSSGEHRNHLCSGSKTRQWLWR